MSEQAEPATGIKVTAVDLVTGEGQSRVIEDDYSLVCAGTAYLVSTQVHANGTHVLTVKGVRRA